MVAMTLPKNCAPDTTNNIHLYDAFTFYCERKTFEYKKHSVGMFKTKKSTFSNVPVLVWTKAS